MSRYTPQNFGGDLAPLNPELEKIKEAVDDTLSRKGDTPNAMEADIDMNGQRIFNLPTPKTPTEAVRLKDVQEIADTGLPPQEGQSGKYLQSLNGTAVWRDVMTTVTSDPSWNATNWDAAYSVTQNLATVATSGQASDVSSTDGDVQSDIDSLQLKQLQKQAEQELKRNAAFYADFTKDDAIVSTGLSKVASGVASAITVANPDGITGIGPDGRIYDSGVGNAPIVYDGSGECQGLQVAPSSTNLLLWSEDLSNAAWSKSNATVTSSSTVSPIPSSSYQKLSSDGSLNEHSVFQSGGSFDGEKVVTGSCVVKADELSNVTIRLAGGGIDNIEKTFSLDKTPETGKEYLANNSYRVSLSGVTLPSGGSVSLVIALSDGSNTTFSGQQGEGVLVTATQMKEGSLAPYVKTEASQVTRGVVFAKHDFNCPSSFTAFAEMNAESYETQEKANPYVFSVSDGTVSNYYGVLLRSGGRVTFRCSYSDDIDAYVGFSGGLLKIAFTVDVENNETIFYLNGSKIRSTPFTSSPVTSGVIDKVEIGHLLGESLLAKSTTRKTSITPKILTDTEAIALTALEQ